MADFMTMRTNMVKSQIMPNGVTHPSLLRAFKNIPREHYVPLALKGIAYLDGEIELTSERALMPPMSFAKLAQIANIHPRESVLDIGSGFGYSSIILSFVAKKVIGLESHPKMTDMARIHLEKLEVSNLTFETAPLTEGWAEEAPYDLIFIEGIAEKIPEVFFKQLSKKGRIVTFEKNNPFNFPTGVIYFNEEGDFTKKVYFQAPAPVLSEFKDPAGFRFELIKKYA